MKSLLSTILAILLMSTNTTVIESTDKLIVKKEVKITPVVIEEEIQEEKINLIIDNIDINWNNEYRPEEIKKEYQDVDKELLAKLLYCEAGTMGFDGQVFVCSAILNLCEYYNLTLEEASHNENIFEVAPYFENAEYTDYQIEVINFVLNQVMINEVCYFRTDHYHDFGIPLCEINNIYFSMGEE